MFSPPPTDSGARASLSATPRNASRSARAFRNTFLIAALAFASALPAADDRPQLSGTWQLNPSKSKLDSPVASIELTIQQGAKDRIQFTRTVRLPDGKDAVSSFECTSGGPDCAFDEGGHKSKVSLWYQGAELVILKTDGPGSDEVSQWNLKRLDKGTMQVSVSHITPAAADETMVFDSKNAIT